MFFGPYGPPFSREGRNIPIFFIALRSSGSFGHAGLLSALPEFAGFLSRRGCPVAAAHGFRSRCVHLTRHSEPGFRRFVPAPGLLRRSASPVRGARAVAAAVCAGFSFGGRSGLPERIPVLSGGPGCVPVLRIPPPHVRRCRVRAVRAETVSGAEACLRHDFSDAGNCRPSLPDGMRRGPVRRDSG